MIIPHGISAGLISNNLINAIKPEYVVYSQLLSKTSKSSKTSKMGASLDPLYMILDQNRFNIKEKGVIKITSDGSEVKII